MCIVGRSVGVAHLDSSLHLQVCVENVLQSDGLTINIMRQVRLGELDVRNLIIESSDAYLVSSQSVQVYDVNNIYIIHDNRVSKLFL